MSITEKDIDSILFKPLILHQHPGEIDGLEHLGRFIIPYGSNIQTTQSVSLDGEREKTTNFVIYFFDLGKTIEFQEPVIEAYPINTEINNDEFHAKFAEIDLHDRLNDIVIASTIIGNTISIINGKLKEYHAVLGAIRYMTKPVLNEASGFADPDKMTEDLLNHIINGVNSKIDNIKQDIKEAEKTLLLTSDLGVLANILYSSIEGLNGKLGENDVRKIGEIVKTVVMNHIDMDINDEVGVRKLEKELEYRVVDALPLSLRAGKITINMESVLKQIKSMNQNEGDDEDSEETDGELT